jgi:hypothetical protein
MAMIDRNFTFATNGTVSAADLHNLIDSATIYQDLITGQLPITSVGTNYELLIADGTNPNAAPNAVTVYDLFEDALTAGTYTNANISAALTYGTATGTRLVSANATITTGTITTGVIPTLTSSTATFGTTTSTAATITSGTVTNLASTTGTIATLNSTTGTITTLNSTTGTIATLNSTTGTIATLNSTTGTIATLNSTTGTIPTLVATTLITTGAGTAAAPAIVPTGDTNTGIFFPAADTIAFAEGGTEGMRIDSSGRLGIGATNPQKELQINATEPTIRLEESSGGSKRLELSINSSAEAKIFANQSGGTLILGTVGTERLRIDASGNVLVGKTTTAFGTAGALLSTGANEFTVSDSPVLNINRITSDGTLINFFQAGTSEGSIQVSGTTVSYNGGHLSRWSQLLDGQRDPAIKKGTVLSNLDAMCEWRDADGNLLPNEQLNKVKISDVEGDSNTAGVFVNWDNDDQDNPYDLNMAMTGDMIIRIAQGTSVNRGDLLMSAGDGTAKPQGDDIIRSKTIAKVTSNNVTCTYEDGSYCVPCVLMAC